MDEAHVGLPLDELVVASVRRMKSEGQVGEPDFDCMTADAEIEPPVALLGIDASGVRKPRRCEDVLTPRGDEGNEVGATSGPTRVIGTTGRRPTLPSRGPSSWYG